MFQTFIKSIYEPLKANASRQFQSRRRKNGWKIKWKHKRNDFYVSLNCYMIANLRVNRRRLEKSIEIAAPLNQRDNLTTNISIHFHKSDFRRFSTLQNHSKNKAIIMIWFPSSSSIHWNRWCIWYSPNWMFFISFFYH